MIYIHFFPYCLFVSYSQVIGCEDRPEMTYTVSGGVLNSAQPNQFEFLSAQLISVDVLLVSQLPPTIWNELPAAIREANTLNTFKRHLKTHHLTSSL